MHVQNLSDTDITMLCLYDDDLLITESNKNEIEKFKCTMHSEFETIGLGKLSYFLGMKYKTIKTKIVT